MRTGQVRLKDYDDEIEVCRPHDSALKVVCISNYPNRLLNKAIATGEALQAGESVNLVAHPATGNEKVNLVEP